MYIMSLFSGSVNMEIENISRNGLPEEICLADSYGSFHCPETQLL